LIQRACIVILFTLCLHFNAYAQSPIAFQQIATGISRPVAITHAGDASGRLFITSQRGKIFVYDGSQLLATPFLDLSSLIPPGCATNGNCGERGLLSVAFHPNYESNGFFYVYYTDQSGDLNIARYKATPPSSNTADPNSGLILKHIPHPTYGNHNGGQLQFGPDGFLYAGTGDGGGGGDPDEHGQNKNALLGKLLRLDVNASSPYIPASNPFGNEVWAFGLRNPWRFSFDRVTGDLFIGDVGQNCYEEVSFQPAGSAGGLNYGWDVMEGKRCYDEPGDGSNCNLPPTCVLPEFVAPILVYSHSGTTNCAVTGGYRYRGVLYPSLTGLYIYGDYCSGTIWGASEDSGTWTATSLTNTAFSITTFGEDENGELYVADSNTGTIYQITAPNGLPFTDDFEDGDASDWNTLNGNWTVVAGNLEGSTTKKATNLAPFAGCSLCTIETDINVVTPGGIVYLLGWYINKANSVELQFKEDQDKIVLKQRVGGAIVAKTKVDQIIDAATNIHVKITYDGTQFQVFLNGSGTPAITLPSGGFSSGSVAFRVKSTTKSNTIGRFMQIQVY
jgi:glucose/arabinose dehydrogenase